MSGNATYQELAIRYVAFYVITFGLATKPMNSIFLILSLLASTNVAAQQVSPHAQKAAQTIQQLRAIGMPDADDVDPAPPPKVPSLLRLLNQELRALIAEDLNDPNRHAVPSEKEILEQLTAAGWEEIPSHKWNAYGEIRQIKFDWKTGYEPGILVVSTQLWLPCGSADPDSAIYVFQGIARRWDLVLAAESDFDPAGENDITGMQYKISPPDSHGHWFVVVAHVPPSCGRASTTLRYKALRPGTSLNQPILLLSGRESINPFFQPAFRVDTEKYSFALTLGKLRKLDGEPGIAIFRYGLSGDEVRRMAPLALTPEDFLDQWAQLNWDEAKRWTRDPSDSVLEKWHSQLNSLASDSTEIESVQLCTGTSEGDGDWLLQLSVDGRLNPSLKVTTLYASMSKTEGTFVLSGVVDKPPSACSGRTPLTPIVEPSLPQW
jgi:hypothetical protein